MFLKQIKFNKAIKFDSARESNNKHFKVGFKSYEIDNKRKPIYDNDSNSRFGGGTQIGYEKQTITERYFTIFKKNLTIDFDSNITIIVGDNGTGKTSLIKNLQPPDTEELDFISIFSDKSKEDIVKEKYSKYLSNVDRNLTFSNSPKHIIIEKNIHKNSFVNELDKELQNDKYAKATTFALLWDMQSYSNGESNLDFINGLVNIENSLIVLDEPETSLSIKSQKMVREIIKELSVKNQIIIITHSEHMMRLSDKVYDFEKKKYVETEKYIKIQLK